MLNEKNANRYVKNNLQINGIAVLNVGNGNYGDVLVYKKN